jgi:hypothetical protein
MIAGYADEAGLQSGVCSVSTPAGLANASARAPSDRRNAFTFAGLSSRFA